MSDQPVAQAQQAKEQRAAAPIQRVGVPLAMLQASKGMQVTVELADRQRWSGKVVNVDDAGNIELCNAKHWDGTSAARDVVSTILRGGTVLYVQLPQEELSAQFPILNLVQRATKKTTT
jgi:small nuclear ribonucleoprotein (snRNP)-like protein